MFTCRADVLPASGPDEITMSEAISGSLGRWIGFRGLNGGQQFSDHIADQLTVSFALELRH